MEKIGQHLRKIRQKSKISLKDVYKKTGITDSILSRIEKGNTVEPAPSILRKLAVFYNIDLISLYKSAGYLTNKDLKVYQQFFSGIDSLSEEEKEYIQSGINLLNRK